MRNFIKIFVNILTSLRLLFTMIALLFFKKMPHTIFFILATIILFTDFLDGKLARKYKVQTIFGANLDTIADKFLSIGLILILIKQLPILYLLLIGEIIISIINITAKIINKKTKSSKIGKIKTWMISLTILIAYITYFKKITYFFITIFSILSFIMQIIVGNQYFYSLITSPSIKNKNNPKNIKEWIYQMFSTKYYYKVMKEEI